MSQPGCLMLTQESCGCCKENNKMIIMVLKKFWYKMQDEFLLLYLLSILNFSLAVNNLVSIQISNFSFFPGPCVATNIVCSIKEKILFIDGCIYNCKVKHFWYYLLGLGIYNCKVKIYRWLHI